MLYDETHALTMKLECMLFSCNREMNRYMAKVTWKNYVVVWRWGMSESGAVLRVRWFRYVVRKDETEILEMT